MRLLMQLVGFSRSLRSFVQHVLVRLSLLLSLSLSLSLSISLSLSGLYFV